MIDRATIDKIMEATNIVDVVSEFVSLKKRGVNYIGLCPFHNDSHPSFSVSPSRGICHCFTCGKGGNAVNFLMELEQMSYPDALRWLARKYHIEIQERELSDEEKQKENERESMFIVNEWAANYFQDVLHKDVDGLAVGMPYFRSRGFRDDIIQKFKLGFALNERSALSDAATKKGYKSEYLVKTGLCVQREDGKIFDRFSGRAIFPWFGVSGKVVAFGGRVLDSRTKGVNQKYVNSPDSDIYHKERELYGIFQAKKAISREDCVYMVEGYTDVISMHQCGIENVVANSGTALSVYQIRMLRRFTRNITFIYDGDAAGIHAALRGTDIALREGMNLKMLLLPDGDDPDSFARNHSSEEVKEYIKTHQTDFIEFKMNLMLKGVTDPIKRSEAINSIVQSISMVTDQILRATYVHDCAQRLGMREETLISQMNRFIRSGKDEMEKNEARAESVQQKAPVQGGEQQVKKTGGEKKVEKMLIRMVVLYGERMITVQDNEGNDIELPLAQYVAMDLGADNLKFTNEIYNRILEECVAHLDDEDFKAETYFTQHYDPEVSKVAGKLCVRFQLSESLKMNIDAMKLKNTTIRLVVGFRLDYVEHHLMDLKNQLKQPGIDAEQQRSLMEEYMKMQKIRNLLAQSLGSNIIK